jgi:hypothetical protein
MEIELQTLFDALMKWVIIPMAVSALRRVSQVRRQISSVLMVLKKVRRIRKQSSGLFFRIKTAALKLLYSSSCDEGQFRHTKLTVDFSDDVAFQATNDLAFTLPVFFCFLT